MRAIRNAAVATPTLAVGLIAHRSSNNCFEVDVDEKETRTKAIPIRQDRI